MDAEKGSWLPAVSLIAALLSCYGTLGLVAALGALGIAFNINDSLWATIIVILSAVNCLALAKNYHRHGRIAPVLIGSVGLMLIIFVMLANYEASIEIIGFCLLFGAVLWDRRQCRARCDINSS